MRIYLIIFLILIPTSLAFTATSTNYQLTKSQEGYTVSNTSQSFTINSAFYEQNINTSLASSNIKVCEGFYCLFRIISLPRGSAGGPDSVAAALIPTCREGETLVLRNETYFCLGEDGLREITAVTALLDLRSILVIMVLVTSIIFLEGNRRKNLKDYQFKKQTFKKKENNEEEKEGL